MVETRSAYRLASFERFKEHAAQKEEWESEFIQGLHLAMVEAGIIPSALGKLLGKADGTNVKNWLIMLTIVGNYGKVVVTFTGLVPISGLPHVTRSFSLN